jgi:hypothetical protein
MKHGTGRSQTSHSLSTFGCVGYVKVTKPNLGKLEDRSVPMVFLGYEAGSKAYRLFDPDARRVVISRDVVFDEGSHWNWEESGDGEDGGGGVDNSFSVEYSEYYIAADDAAGASHQDSAGGSSVSETGGASPAPGAGESVPTLPVASPPPSPAATPTRSPAG